MGSLTLGLTAGDYNGIGPEILIKSLSDPEITGLCRFTVFGPRDVFTAVFERFSSEQKTLFESGYTTVINSLSPEFQEKTIYTPGTPTDVSGRAAYSFLTAALDCWGRNECGGIITGPIVKRTFFPPGETEFHGQTEWIAHRINARPPLMLMVGKSLRIGITTTHIALRDVPGQLTADRIAEKGDILHDSLIDDFGIENPRIAVCGLNPHCGEEEMFGDEERTVLAPALERLRRKGGEWTDPLPADTIFEPSVRREFDGILALYHDQGLIPFKMHCGFSGVNFTAGLPLVRTSPDHGVAMNIAGRGTANPGGYKEAIRLAANVARRRAGAG